MLRKPKPRRLLLPGLHFHALIDKIIRAARICGRGTVSYHAKSAGGILNFVGVTLASSLLERQRSAGREIVQRSIAAVFSLISAFCLCDGDKVVFHTDNVDRLRRRFGAIGFGLPEIIFVN